MSFGWIDFIAGFLMMGAIVHLAMSHSNVRFPSLLGYSAKGNLIYSIIIASLAVDIYFFANDFSTLINNGLLLGAIDMFIIYLIFGKWLHRKLTRTNSADGVNNVLVN